jgi:putative redox protein
MTDKITITMQDGLYLHGSTPAFPEIIPLDADKSVGGTERGHRPLMVLLVGLGACMSMDAISILKKKRQDFNQFKVEFTEIEQQSDHPRIYTSLHMHFTVGGTNVSDEAVARSLELSYTKYCPANAMLGEVVEISYSYEIVPN